MALLRFPGIFAAVVGASFVLGIATAAAPIFQSSAGSAALASQLANSTPWDAGLSVFAEGLLGDRRPGNEESSITPNQLFAQRDELLRGDTAPLTGLGHGVVTISAVGALQAPGGGRFPVRLLNRTDGLNRISVIASVGGRGIWITEATADGLRVHPGETLTLDQESAKVPVRIAGVYRDLASGPVPAYWQSQTSFLERRTPIDPELAPLALADLETFTAVASQTGVVCSFQWEFPIYGPLSLEQGKVLATNLRYLANRIMSPVPPYVGYFSSPNVRTGFPRMVGDADTAASTLRGPVQTLALAGGLFTVGVAAAVGVYWVRRRRTEMRQLASRGVTATSIGARTLLEAAAPVALGATVSWLVVNWVVPLIGPSDLIDTSAKRSAAAGLRMGAILGLVVIAISVAWGARREAIQAGGKLLRTAVRLPWELLILALAGAALYEIVTRGTTLVSSGGGPPRIDKLLILFPILFMLGSAGLLVRGVGFALGKVRRRGRGLYVSTFLAFRRLTGATRTGLALLSLTAVSTGLLVYAGALAASAANVIDQKSQAYVGSETSVVMGGAEPAIPVGFPFPATLVTRIEPIGTLYPVGSSVEILGVDLGTFPGAAYWASSFADAPLQDLLGRLRGSTTHGLPALVLARGEVPSPPVLRAGSALIPFRAVGQVRDFPGVQTSYSVLVVDRQVASRFLEQSEASRLLLPQHVELWAQGDAGAVQAALRAAGASYTHVVTAQAIRSLPAFLALSWTFGFMRFIGAVVGLISLVGVVLYLQARQRSEELSYALVARMGLSSGAHRRSLALELCVLLELAFLIGGALAILAARLTFSRLDPIPSLPPSISLSVPLLFLTGAAVGLLAAGLIGAAQAQWQANRATPAEVIRLAA